MKNKILKIILVVLIILVAIAGIRWLRMSNKGTPNQDQKGNAIPGPQQ
jgi:flagellar basal body-associated protein FliL